MGRATLDAPDQKMHVQAKHADRLRMLKKPKTIRAMLDILLESEESESEEN